MKKSIHVQPTGNQWIVRSAEEPEAKFQNQYDAETFGRNVAREEKSEFILHDAQGNVRKRDSYGPKEFRV